MRRILCLAVASALAGATRAAAVCTAEATSGRQQMVCAATSKYGKSLRLTFATATVTTDDSYATLCSEPSAAVDAAKLWMPEMGHGSGPTTLTPEVGGCTVVKEIDFLMIGVWQVNVHFPADEDTGVIDVDVTH